MTNSMIPYSFVPGTKAKADEVNANFISLANFIEQNKNSTANEKTILRSKTQQTNSSIDDLPEIVTFPKRELKRQPKKVFKNIINNI